MDAVTVFYLVVINLSTFVLCWRDKSAAVHGSWRIPERVLMFLVIAGGSLGMLIGMHLFHHKTKSERFRITVPVVLVAETVFLVFFYLNLNARI